jgi:protein-L-isoaspartate O-methyltransferase
VITDWQHLAGRLADQLAESGVLRSLQWDAAIRAVPRHVFVPNYVEQQPDLSWRTVPDSDTADTAEWFDAVYSDRPLTTALRTGSNGNSVAISSSSKPGLMIRMLETLELGDTHRVLEIGTGTGYNAGLVCHRVGDSRVASVDIEAKLVELAGKRLASIGYRPTLAAGDGADGLADAEPYDRIIATCSVARIPQCWIDQLAPGGRILTDLKLTGAAGNLVDLRSQHDGLVGRFLSKWAGFMPLRHTAPARAAEATGIAERTTNTPSATPWWDNQMVWFLAALHLPPGITTGLRLDAQTGKPAAARMHATNGEWAEIALEPNPDGQRTVAGSAADLWHHVEDAYQRWHDLDQPGWERFGLTITDNAQTVWFDHPTSDHHWPLP